MRSAKKAQMSRNPAIIDEKVIHFSMSHFSWSLSSMICFFIFSIGSSFCSLIVYFCNFKLLFIFSKYLFNKFGDFFLKIFYFFICFFRVWEKLWYNSNQLFVVNCRVVVDFFRRNFYKIFIKRFFRICFVDAAFWFNA